MSNTSDTEELWCIAAENMDPSLEEWTRAIRLITDLGAVDPKVIREQNERNDERQRLLGDVFMAPDVEGPGIDNAVVKPMVQAFMETLAAAHRANAHGVLMLAADDQPLTTQLDLRRCVVPPAWGVLPNPARFVHPSRVFVCGRIVMGEALMCRQLTVGMLRKASVKPMVDWALTAIFGAQDGPTCGRIPETWTLHWPEVPHA